MCLPVIRPCADRSFSALETLETLDALDALGALGTIEAVVRGAGDGLFAGVAFATTRAAFGWAVCLFATGVGADAARRDAFTAAASGGFAAVWVKAVVALAFAGLLGALVPAADTAFLAASASGCEASFARLAPGLDAAFGDVFVAMVKLGCVVGIGLVRPSRLLGIILREKMAKVVHKLRTQTSFKGRAKVLQRSCKGRAPGPRLCSRTA